VIFNLGQLVVFAESILISIYGLPRQLNEILI